LRTAVGIFAHNEERTIEQVLRGFVAQEPSSADLDEVIVVCCGCTDATVAIAQRMAACHPRIRVIVRGRREGKVAAINHFLDATDAGILVLSGADVVPASDLVERLVVPFAADPRCMMTGPRVLTATAPQPSHVVDHLHDILWFLHHAVASRRPKLGEIVAVRRDFVDGPLPAGVHCDEALIESMVSELGGRLAYVEDALVYNFAPATLGELYRQRRRIAAQHRDLRRLRGYRPATCQPGLVAQALLMVPFRRLPLLSVLGALEGAARIHGNWDSHRGRSYQTWQIPCRVPAAPSGRGLRERD
jgi:cellulose synthase/poly-beta-1,6-N-acetylglucosamine synthase-like glycosyltransferase